MKTPDSTDPWEDLFRQRFDDFQAEPPADALERILAGGNTGKMVSQANPSGRWRELGFGILALLLLIGGSYLLTEKQAIVEQKQNNTTPFPQDARVAEAPSEDNTAKSSLTKENKPTKQKKQLIEVEEIAENSPDAIVTVTKQPEATQIGKSTSVNKELPEHQKNVSRTQGSALPTTLSTPTPIRNAPQQSRGQISGRIERFELGHPQKQELVAQETRYTHNEYTKNLVDKNRKQPFQNQDEQATSEPQVGAISTLNHSLSTLLAGRKLKALSFPLAMPLVVAPTVATPQQSRSKLKPGWVVSLMPMYTFRQISPNTADNLYVQQVKAQGRFATERIGWRLQAGLEWPLSKQVGLRTTLVYAQLQQTVRYALRSEKQDSVVVDLIDDETIRLTPVFVDQVKTQTNIWHYTGLSADVVWRLGAGQHWHYFATVGASGGAYLGPVKHLTGFYQGSLGMERLISEHLWIRVEPSLQYGWNAVTDNKALFLIRPYTYGLTIGVRY